MEWNFGNGMNDGGTSKIKYNNIGIPLFQEYVEMNNQPPLPDYTTI